MSKRRTIRAPVNPQDKATIFSIFPREIVEVKHTIQPGTFVIPAGTIEKPSRLVVGPSSWWTEVDPYQPLLEIPTGAIQIANSVVQDYCQGLLAYSAGEREPGIFYLQGDVPLPKMIAEYKVVFDKVVAMQKAWYAALVDIADALWARSNGNPMSLSLDMKQAALFLGMEHKDWMQNHQRIDLIRCVACGNMISNAVVVCPNCKVIVNAARAKELNLQFAS